MSDGWSVYDFTEDCREVHVIPECDIRPHECSAACACEPGYEVYANGNTLYIHKAFDFREVNEAIEEGNLFEE